MATMYLCQVVQTRAVRVLPGKMFGDMQTTKSVTYVSFLVTKVYQKCTYFTFTVACVDKVPVFVTFCVRCTCTSFNNVT